MNYHEQMSKEMAATSTSAAVYLAQIQTLVTAIARNPRDPNEVCRLLKLYSDVVPEARIKEPIAPEGAYVWHCKCGVECVSGAHDAECWQCGAKKE